MEKYKLAGLGIEITRQCNMSCAHCFRGEAQETTISEQIIDKFFSEIQDTRRIYLSGGEPLLELDKIDYIIMKISTSKWTTNYIEVTTNGTICDKRIIDMFERFCIEMDGRVVCLRISNDPFHNAQKSEQAYSFYNPLIEAANDRLNNAGSQSKIFLKYTARNGINKNDVIITYVGRAKELIDSGGQRPRNIQNVKFPKPYEHRLLILRGNEVQCMLELCANGNISFCEMLEWETIDKISFGNILNDNMTNIIENHNHNCTMLCSETDKLNDAIFGRMYTNWDQWAISQLKARELLYNRILELRNKAKKLFPNVPARYIIEELHFPVNEYEELKIYEEIYKGYDFYNADLASALYNQADPKYLIKKSALLQAVIICLQDRTTRRRPYYLLGNENDIINSSHFKYFNKLNMNNGTLDNEKNFFCDKLEDGGISYDRIQEDIESEINNIINGVDIKEALNTL